MTDRNMFRMVLRTRSDENDVQFVLLRKVNVQHLHPKSRRQQWHQRRAVSPSLARIRGSPREFGGTSILGGFLENHKFSPGRGYPLGLQEQIAEVLVSAAAAQQ